MCCILLSTPPFVSSLFQCVAPRLSKCSVPPPSTYLSPLTLSIHHHSLTPFTPLHTSNEPSLSEAQRAWDSLVSTSEPYRVVFTIHTLLCLFRLHVDKQQYSETIGVLRRLLEVGEEARSQN